MAQHFNQTARTLAVTANRLGDGAVVYFTGETAETAAAEATAWSERLADVAVARSKEEGAALLAQAEPSVAARHIIGPYLFEVAETDGAPAPVNVRETIRMRGPSVRLDLGYQATQKTEETRHVSL